MSADPIAHSLAQGPARELVAGMSRLGAAVGIPIGAATMNQQPGYPRITLLAVETTPPGALAPLFTQFARRIPFEPEAITWGTSLDDQLESAYAWLDVHTSVDGARHFMIVFEEVSMWRAMLFDEPRPEVLLIADGSDERLARVLGGQDGSLEGVDMIELPNPPLPLVGFSELA
jgi:hypothetical protein